MEDFNKDLIVALIGPVIHQKSTEHLSKWDI